MFNPWIYENKSVDEEFISSRFGFIYIITNNITGRHYIGKKLTTGASTKVVDGKKKKIRKPSDWKNYWGSSRFIKEDIQQYGKENYTREILFLCDSKSEMNYLENYLIFKEHALLSDRYMNHWTTVQITDKHLGKVKEKYRGTLFND